MSPEHIAATDPRVNAALNQLKGLITAQYPSARFTVFEGEDPEGVYLEATVDIEDSSEALGPVLDKLYELEVDQELPIYVVTSQPGERVAAQLAARLDEPRPGLSQLTR
jgi:hypothetical protein